MGKMKNFLVFFAFCLIVWLTESNKLAEAAEAKGILQITLKEGMETAADTAEVVFHVYRVGTAGEKPETPKFYEKYGIADYPQTAEEIEGNIERLLSILEEAPLQSKTSDSGGFVEFGNLSDGIYLVVADEENSYGKIMPFLVCLPCYETIEEVSYGPFYRVEAEPKAEPYGGEAPTENPGETEMPEDTSGAEHTTESDKNTKGSSAVRTGDRFQTGFYICFFLAGVMLAYSIYKNERRRSK